MIAGDTTLCGLLRPGQKVDRRQRPYAGLIEINSTGGPSPGRVENGAVRGRQRPGFRPTVEQLANMLDAFIGAAEPPEMIYFTGAEMACHPQLDDLIEVAYEKGVTRVGLQCDGLRITHDDHSLTMLAGLKPLIFLEFDGFDETTSLILHGRRDLPFEAMRALDRLAAAGLRATLLTTVVKGVNLQEVGAVAVYGQEHGAVSSAIFRPISPHKSRLGNGSAGQVSAADIIAALEQQSHGLFSPADFSPVFCCQPTRHFVARIPVVAQGQAAAVEAAGSRPDQHQPTVPVGLVNGSSRTPEGEASCFWLGVHDFMNHWSCDARKAQHCPLVVITPDGRRVPYCTYNALDVDHDPL